MSRRHVRWADASALVLCVLLTLGAAPPAQAKDKPIAKVGTLKRLLGAIQREKDPAKRTKLVEQLVTFESDAAADALGRIVREDPELAPRQMAAGMLGLSRSDRATAVLIQLVRHGGTRDVRRTVAASIDRRKGGDALITMLESRTATPRDRRLAAAAMAHLRDPTTAEYLTRLARGKTSVPGLREVAIRAASARPDLEAMRLRLFLELTSRAQSRSVRMTTLDAAEAYLHPMMRVVLKSMASGTDSDLAETAKHLLKRLAALKTKQAEAKKDAPQPHPKKEEGGRYAEPVAPPHKPTVPTMPPPPPPVPGARPAIDTVWLLDATGSTSAHLGTTKRRTIRRMQALAEGTPNARFGIVVYRGGHGAADVRRGISVLPLTFDRQLVIEFLRTTKSSGTDDRGSAVPHALHVALDQMCWRENCRTAARLEADGGLRNVSAATKTVSMHHRADQTRTYVTYTQRSRTKTPEGLNDIAGRGGTDRMEIVR